ncbi:PEP-CTERM sorting domain-containing protein [Pseudoduganella plicata]|uniref:PEP-CTERM sorting domain-containing protein n=1 Tax=Pseudoduganella plicata TaxID=321984 RepID=A0A4P7BJN0_9BURK|nr:PEP-CTERM sorting domain-containing protein [Pseudoduganella plicata]QBQ39144.1 hypothetical protein E1742_25660 [Pseudoduganella plicata]GGY87676.1 hypothetical protein GCM10007388_21320 [Pseudoduganella plicata]
MQALLSRAVLTGSLLTAGTVQAAIDTHAFTLGAVPTYPYADITLLSDTATRATFALDGLAQGLRSDVDSTGEAWATADTPWQNFYDITVRDGYRITGMTVTGTFHGALAGHADNDIGVAFLAWAPGSEPVWSSPADAAGLNGERGWSIGTGPTSLDGTVVLGFLASASSYAASTWQPDAGTWLGSSAQIGARDLVLSIEVAPVPEPQAWLMLLVGTAVAGAWRAHVSAARNGARR